MPIDIENPGGSEAALKEALRDLVGGMRFISSVSISSPVEYVDVALPAGYSSFQLFVTGIAFDDSSEQLAAVFSADAGATFFCDTTNFDTYAIIVDAMATSSEGSISPDISLTMDSIIYLTSNSITAEGLGLLSIDIYPGSASASFSLLSRARWTESATNAVMEINGSELNPEATVPPTFARADLIRILPLGNGDVDPPTSGLEMTSGTFVLLGVPE